MNKKKLIIISSIILLLVIIGYIATHNNDVNNIKNFSGTNNVETIESKEILKEYYKDNEIINKFINIFNEMYPEDQISSDMLSVYNHHGNYHKEQVQFYLNNLQITLTGSIGTDKNEISVYIDNTKNSNSDETLRSLTKKFIKVYNDNITDKKIDEYLNSQESASDINKYDGIEYWTSKTIDSNIIESIKIIGNL